MKLFILALTTLSALCTVSTNNYEKLLKASLMNSSHLLMPQGENLLRSPELKLISPDVTFEHAWLHQKRLAELQDDINQAIHEVQTALSSVLQNSTRETLEQFESHVGDIEARFVPEIERFNQLRPSVCRNSAQTILNHTTEFTGFSASNCATSYDSLVRIEVAAANGEFFKIDQFYSQVQMIVVRAFVGQNAFINPEAIQHKITEIYESLEWKQLG
jgi:hypothetical protein